MSRSMSRTAVLAGGLTLLAGLAASTPRASSPTPRPRPEEVSRAPLLMSERSDDLDEIRRTIGRLVDGVGWPSAEWSILVLSLENGDTLFARDPDRPLAPASNVKLLTTSAALHYLGPDFRYNTLLVADGTVTGESLRGDLIVYGTGDPGLSGRFYPDRTTALEMMADSLLEAGIRRIEGDLVGDGSFFTGPLLPTGWEPADLNDWFAAPTSALSVSENVVSIRVEPGRADGTRPVVHTLPDGPDLPIANRATTGAGRLHILRGQPTDSISIEGRIPRGGRDVWRQLTVGDPIRYATELFRGVLERRGIRVAGEVRTVHDPARSRVTGRRIGAPALGRSATRVLVQHRSPPLVDYLEVVNKKSHNFLAETILKTLGRVVAGDGSYRGGIRVLKRFLTEEVQVDTSKVVLEDGSGLSALNRMSAADFTGILAYMAGSPLWQPFWYTLPEAGDRRELARMYRTPAAGNLRAKTGTIDDVSALSGLVRTTGGERVAFSILGNGLPSTWGAKRLEDRIGARLAGLDRGWEPRGVRLAGRLTPVNPGPGSETETSSQPPSRTGATGPGDHAAPPDRYRVREGDNLTVIARRFGVSLDALREANPAITPRRMRPGQWLQIPSGPGS